MKRKGRCWIFATDHKTGTVWQMNMSRVFCEELGAQATWVSHREHPSIAAMPDRDYVVFFERSFLFADSRWPEHPNLRGIRMVRDPRDVIISGAEYHARGSEAWLCEPQERFDGQSYSQQLQSLESQVDRLRFEMRHLAARTIQEMAGPSDSRLQVIRYEDLYSWETAPGCLLEISHWLELDEDESRALTRAHSLTHLENQSTKPAHATRGIRTRWIDEWPSELDDEFATLFAKQIPYLPYELPTQKNSGW